MTYKVLRGTKDILPDEMPLWHFVEETARDIFDTYNFTEIRTPIFEAAELFERGVGEGTDIVAKEMYTFNDKGDRRITLRPEGTAPIVRSVLENPELIRNRNAKLYYSGPMFRYERPQKGRYRQFHQMGIEYIGNASAEADVEVISLAYRLFEKLGLKNLKVIVNSIGDDISRPVINEAIRQHLGNSPWLEKELCTRCIPRFNQNPLRILDCKNDVCNQYLSGLPDIKNFQSAECKDHFHMVIDGLNQISIPFHIDSNLVRGLDYYTKTTFEIVSDQLGAQNAVCGGGRYDTLLKQMGGKAVPAVGFAFGMERVISILKDNKVSIPVSKRPLAYVAVIDENQKIKSQELLDILRNAGVKSETDDHKTDLKGHLKSANKLNARATLILGEDEIKSQSVTIKDMKTGEQVTVKKSDIVLTVQQIISNDDV